MSALFEVTRRAYRELLAQVPPGMQMGAPRLVETWPGVYRVEADLYPIVPRAAWLDAT